MFVAASPSTLHAIHGFEVTDELQQCLQSHHPGVLPWTHVRPPAGRGRPELIAVRSAGDDPDGYRPPMGRRNASAGSYRYR